MVVGLDLHREAEDDGMVEADNTIMPKDAKDRERLQNKLFVWRRHAYEARSEVWVRERKKWKGLDHADRQARYTAVITYLTSNVRKQNAILKQPREWPRQTACMIRWYKCKSG
eukprot:5784095-Pleurochrysis_carterae.AAC.2